MRKSLSIIIFIALSLLANAQIQLSPYAQISLVTCGPGEELYTKFGHTAIRVHDDSLQIVNSRTGLIARGMDIVFNYGVFSFNSEGFYAKFVRGETYYRLVVENAADFFADLQDERREYRELQLNITAEQKQALLDRLLVNAQPENCRYLYNFLFDNCATRPHRLLENILGQKLRAAQPLNITWRNIITRRAEKYSWGEFGINLVFGKDADTLMTSLDELFLPERVQQSVADAILNDGSPLTDTNEQTLMVFPEKKFPFLLSPYMLVIVLCLILIAITCYDVKRKKTSLWIEGILTFLFGVLGLLIFYLMFFSIHPMVRHNYNFLFFNPLLFLVFIAILIPRMRVYIKRYAHILGIIFLCLLLLRLVCGQVWHPLLYVVLIWAIRLCIIGLMQRKSKEQKPLFLISIALICLSLLPNQATASPRLTVVVCIDGLNEKNMNEMRPYWSAGGLRTIDEEAHSSIVSFPQLVEGGIETLATILTGVEPARHGIAADNYFARNDRKIHSIFEDNNQTGIGSDKKISPVNLLSPTIADEFRMQMPDKSKIFAIGIDAQSTILLAGHSANACTWIDKNNLCWATTTYYSGGLPTSADQQNQRGRIRELAERQWYPRLDIGMYMHPTENEQKKPYNFRNEDVLLNSPAANTLVVELALEMQKEEQLGKDIYPDMILLQLTTVSPHASSDYISSAEQEDMYLSLNQDLGFLLEQLDKRIGQDNYQIILFGIPHFGIGADRYQKAGLPIHYFNVDRASALINTYLMAMYGHERWIDGGFGHSIYLNHTLIEQKKMSITDLQRQVSNFLLEFEGTQAAYSIQDIDMLCTQQEQQLLLRTVNKKQFGDVVFILQPQWLVGESADKKFNRVIETMPTTPLYIRTKQRITAPAKSISATEIKSFIMSTDRLH